MCKGYFHMSCSPNFLQGIIKGTAIGDSKGDTGSLD